MQKLQQLQQKMLLLQEEFQENLKGYTTYGSFMEGIIPA